MFLFLKTFYRAKMRQESGIIYLIHFDEPLRRGIGGNDNDTVRHYLGWTSGKLTNGLNSYDLLTRMERHLTGDGARILRALNERGIGWRPVAAWDKYNPPSNLKRPNGYQLARWRSGNVFRATRDDERILKRQKKARRYCPVCNAV